MPCSGNADSYLETGKELVPMDQLPQRYDMRLPPSTFTRGRHGNFIPCDQSRICNISPLAIGFLDLANSGDFAANVFNRVPIPVYVIVLMAVGATVALLMSFVALQDAKRSLKNIELLREERRSLEEMDGDRAVELEINRRDLGTEIFDRAGVEIAMGVGAFLIAIGTYMAIGGANRKVWFASNLLSGYVGNALPALYGLCNVGWSVHIWLRAHGQARAASIHLRDTVSRELLLHRVQVVQEHAILTAVVCLVSGALSMVTPTHWWPYPVLLVSGLAFLYGSWMYKSRIGYERPLLTHLRPLDKAYLVDEIRFLQPVKASLKDNPNACFAPQLEVLSVSDLLLFLTRCGLFERFCCQLLNGSCFVEQHFETLVTTTTTLDYQVLSNLDKREQIAEVVSFARSCIERDGLQQVSIRERYLLECLGCCMINQRNDDKDG